jgi:CBS-domain-containing membrane protein
VPVVDDGGRFLGFVSSSGLASLSWPWRLINVTPARHLAFGPFLSVSESDPVGSALRIMAHRGARMLALVDSDGTMVGVLSDVDALRAFHGPLSHP